MNSCSICKTTKSLLFCKKCDELFCFGCLKQLHENSNDLQTHLKNIKYICEECENEESKVHCPLCEQNLCIECDTKIHNKGQRAKHVRT